MENLIPDIQKKLTKDVCELNYVDQDWGQMDFFPNPPVKYPCALIDIQSVEYSNNGDFIQHGVATIAVRVFDMKLSNSSNGAPQNQKNNAKKIWKLIADIHKSIHGQNFLQEGFGLPIRQQMRRTKRNDGCYQTELYYTIQFTDAGTQSTPKTTTAKPEMTVTLLHKK